MGLKISPVLCHPFGMRNYAYVLVDESTNLAAVVDAADAAPVIEQCEALGVSPQYILTTHHHPDHTAGNEALQNKYGAEIVCSEAEKDLILNATVILKDGDTFQLGQSKCEVMLAKGHTEGHLLYYFRENKALFTGDVLFNLCIGGLFEGTAEEMFESLQKIKALDDDVRFYPGHDYASFGFKFLPQDLQKEYQKEFPVLLGTEKKLNPYLQPDQLETFKKLLEG